MLSRGIMKIHTQRMSPGQGDIAHVSWLGWEPCWEISPVSSESHQPPRPPPAEPRASNSTRALWSHNPSSKAGGWRHSTATATPETCCKPVARGQPQLPPQAGSSLTAGLFLAGRQEDTWAAHPKQVWPGQPVSPCPGRGALPACSAAAEPVEAVLPGASRQPQRAALPTQASSPSRRPARQPGAAQGAG